MSDTLSVIAAPERDLVPREQSGMYAMAAMPEGEFEVRIQALKRGQDRIKRIKQELMDEGTHYGVIPGTKKPTLLKPGAEVLCSIYGLRPDFLPTTEVGDGAASPTLRVTMRCELHLGDITGPVVAVGYGSANSWERKHRYRRGERVCPACGVVGHIIRGKEEYGGGWLCWKSKGGCGAKWDAGATEIESQQVGDVDNPDPYDIENTLLKMAKKRALLDAALTGTASSDLFTQDLEEGGPGEDEHAKRSASREPAQRAEVSPPVGTGPLPASVTTTTRQPGEDDGDPAWNEDPKPVAKPAAQRAGVAPACPKCCKDAFVIPAKFGKFAGKGWVCWAKHPKGVGCGHSWAR